MNRRINQAVAVRLTRIFLRVTHFMKRSRLQDRKKSGKAIDTILIF